MTFSISIWLDLYYEHGLSSQNADKATDAVYNPLPSSIAENMQNYAEFALNYHSVVMEVDATALNTAPVESVSLPLPLPLPTDEEIAANNDSVEQAVEAIEVTNLNAAPVESATLVEDAGPSTHFAD